MISFTVKVAIITLLIVVGISILIAIGARIFVAFLPAFMLWNLRRKANR